MMNFLSMWNSCVRICLVTVSGVCLSACGDDDSGVADAGRDSGFLSDTGVGTDAGTDSGRPDAGPPTGPSLSLTFPTLVALTGEASLTLEGTTTAGDGAVTAVRVGGETVTGALDAWSHEVDLTHGANEIEIEVEDANGLNESLTTTIHRTEAINNPFSFDYDPAGQLLYYTDTLSNGLFRIDLTTGERALLADNAHPPDATVPYSGTVSTAGIALDIANNRALVLRRDPTALLAVDLTTGDRTVLSDDTTPDADTAFINPSRILYDSAGERAFVVEDSGLAVYVVSLASATLGERTILSSNSVPDGSAPTFSQIVDFAMDGTNNRLVVADRGPGGPSGGMSPEDRILSVDLTTGARSVLSDQDSTGTDLRQPIGMGLHPSEPTAFVFDRDARTIYDVDLTTGERTVLSSNSVPALSRPMRDIRRLYVDVPNSRLIGIDNVLDYVLGVDLTDGARAILHDDRFPGGPFSEPQAIEAGPADTLYVVSVDKIMSVSIATSETEVLSDTDQNLGSNFGAIAYRESSNVLYVLDRALDTVFSVDPTSGMKTVVSSATVPDTMNVPTELTAAAVDEANGRLLVVDGEEDEIVAIDLTSGARTILSAGGAPAGGPDFDTAIDVAVDAARNRALVSNRGSNTLVAVDLSTGARTLVAENGSGGVVVNDAGPIAIHDSTLYWVDRDADQALPFDLTSDTLQSPSVPMPGGVADLVSDGPVLFGAVDSETGEIRVMSVQSGQSAVVTRAGAAS